VKRENEKIFVYIPENGRAVKREVTTGLGNTNDIEILSGLSEGETVVISNVAILLDNAPIRVPDEIAVQ